MTASWKPTYPKRTSVAARQCNVRGYVRHVRCSYMASSRGICEHHERILSIRGKGWVTILSSVRKPGDLVRIADIEEATGR